MPLVRLHARVCLLMLVVVAPYVAAQNAPNVQTVRLDRPEAEFPEPFSTVSGLRALSDGRVLVSDGRERRVVLLDFASKAARAVGRDGAGPGEYAAPRRLWALRGDTTLLHDPGNSRYLVILPGGQPGPTVSLGELPVSGLQSVRGVDAAQHFYFQLSNPQPPGSLGASTGEEVLVRWVRGATRVDTLARVAVPQGRAQGSQDLGGGMLRMLDNRPLAAEDAIVVGSDGRVAIVRAADYHVDWIEPDGRMVSGPPMRYQPIRITEAEKKAHMESMIVPGQIFVRGAPGGQARAMPRSVGGSSGSGRPLPPGFDEASMQWPANKPPFLGGAALIDASGRAWVLRTRAHNDSIPAYDVFDVQGRLSSRVILPKRTRVAGFGRGVVYVVRTDEDDLHYVQRYRME